MASPQDLVRGFGAATPAPTAGFPGATPQPTQPGFQPVVDRARAAGQALGGAWSDWISKPQNMAAMMNMGIALLQPIGVGQSLAGHVGQAIGQGAEAAGRYEKTARDTAIAERETAAREQEAQAAQTRAAATSSAASTYNAMIKGQKAGNDYLLQAAKIIARANGGPEAQFWFDDEANRAAEVVLSDPQGQAAAAQLAAQLQQRAEGLNPVGTRLSNSIGGPTIPSPFDLPPELQ